jgi:molybdopterin-binding protein
MDDMTLGEAAKAIGVSIDTLRRWDRLGRVQTRRDERNRRLVPYEEVQRLRKHPERHEVGGPLSARNRFPGRVVSLEVAGVMALVEIVSGPLRITAAITRDSVEELDLMEGDFVYARVKATSVMVERGDEHAARLAG